MLVTIDDIKKRGYDLTVDGRMNQGDFLTIEDAANQFIEECCNSVWSLIEKNRGFKWTNLFKKDVENDEIKDDLLDLYKNRLKEAMIEQIIFIYENGDYNASGIVDATRKANSPKMLNKLYNFGIMRF